jgi:hypothetical protein
MAFPDLIHTPVYQNALRTPDVLSDSPAKYQPQKRGAFENHHYYQLLSAAFRLDHLMRRALDPNDYPDWPPIYLCSAMKTFVEVIEAKLPSMRPSNQAYIMGLLEPRLEICREIIRRMDQKLAKEGRNPISSDGFRQDMITCGLQVEEIIFENPVYVISRTWFHAGVGHSSKETEQFYSVSHYWK